MKTQIITFSLLLAALSVTSCKNNEASTEAAPVTTTAPTQPETTTPAPRAVAKDSVKPVEKDEDEANEKNEKE